MSKIKLPHLVLIIVVLIGLGYGGYSLAKSMGVSSRAATEAKAEEGERKECEKRLAMFYQAWKSYKADHKGAEPSTIQAMIPKYISDTSLFVCPTAARLDKEKIRLDRGSFEVNRQNVDVTYGFRWMTAGFSKQAKKQGDQMPIVICKCHQQAMYRMAYNKQPHEVSFDDEERAKLAPEVANAPILGVRMNGKVGALDSSTDR
ncbi:MAG: hypothetical protein JWL77_663 [Chthonomonadaceae bacterium]|nr:hypothetical protein [Chthonomonadaceae bacterium]